MTESLTLKAYFLLDHSRTPQYLRVLFTHWERFANLVAFLAPWIFSLFRKLLNTLIAFDAVEVCFAFQIRVSAGTLKESRAILLLIARWQYRVDFLYVV